DDEAEALVRVRGDHHGQRQAGFDLLRLCVECLAEFHDIEAALTQRRPDGRGGVRFACGNLQLDESDDLLCHSSLLMWVQAPPTESIGGSPGYYAFSTCPNSSSTGVDLPKIVTATR